jgi:O-antigen ligase
MTMATVSSANAQQTTAPPLRTGLLDRLEELWRRCSAGYSFLDDGGTKEKSRRTALKLLVLSGIALLGLLWGSAVAVIDVNALYLCVSLIGCVAILIDFRIGVVLLILLMPISRSSVFPHAMFGITGLNPVNLLLVGTFGLWLFHGLSDGSIRRFLPRPLLWLYIVPMVIAGAVGYRHYGEIAPGFFMYGLLEFDSPAGYFRDRVIKPLFLVVFALLVGAAVSRSAKPEKFLTPMLIAIWLMGTMTMVFVVRSGIGINELSSALKRDFLTSLIGMHANELGRLYAVTYALLLFTWAEAKGTGLRFSLLASMGMIVGALVLTFSRSAFLAFIIVNLLFVIWRLNARTMLLFGFLAVGGLFILPGAVFERMTYGFGNGLDAISAGRIDSIWLPLLPEFLKHPILGNGLGSILWSDLMREKGGVVVPGVTHPHSAYLQAILDMGIVGLVLICAYFTHVWKGFRRLSVDPALSPTMHGFYQGAAAGLLSFLIVGVSDSSFLPKGEQVFLWLAIGMMYGQLSKGQAK